MGSWLRQINGARSVNVSTNNNGGWWDMASRPPVGTFAEYTFESWQGKTDSTDFPVLDNFMPNTSVSVFGANWNIIEGLRFGPHIRTMQSVTTIRLLLRDGNVAGDSSLSAHSIVFHPVWTLADGCSVDISR